MSIQNTHIQNKLIQRFYHPNSEVHKLNQCISIISAKYNVIFICLFFIFNRGNYAGAQPFTSGASCTQCDSGVGTCHTNQCSKFVAHLSLFSFDKYLCFHYNLGLYLKQTTITAYEQLKHSYLTSRKIKYSLLWSTGLKLPGIKMRIPC